MAKTHAAKERRAKRRHDANPHRTPNPDMAKAMSELRRSSAASAHDGKSRETRTKAAQKRNAIADSGS